MDECLSANAQGRPVLEKPDALMHHGQNREKQKTLIKQKLYFPQIGGIYKFYGNRANL